MASVVVAKKTKSVKQPRCNVNICSKDQLKSKQEDYTKETNDAICKYASVYDETLPKNDPKFLVPLRKLEKRLGFITPIRWTNTFFIVLLHIVAVVYPAYCFCLGDIPKWQTVLFALGCGLTGGFGVTAGAHRYWTHRSFKANLPLQIILGIAYGIAGQNTIPNWVRDHRIHHKMSETSADPHDVRRGFFFSHVGWLMMKKHPQVISEGSKVEMTDVHNDAVVQFHTKHFIAIKLSFCFVIPLIVPVFLWNETWNFAIISVLLRYMLNLNCTWAVNSFAHIWGNKPYDVHIMPVENWTVSIVAMGEGWHNYHHTFPWDYKAAELSYFLNVTTLVLDGFALIGWAYDMKTASPTLIQSVIDKRGPK